LALTDPQSVEQLRLRLENLGEADFAQVDLQWVRRLRAITETLHRGALLLAALLGAGVLLIVGNTIRLEIDDRRQEIAIMELVGATSAFIRRPFLYSGFWYGMLGGLGAWVLVNLSLLLMQEPVLRLFSLYGNRFELSGIDLPTFLLLVLGSTLLGLLGSWLSVARHIAALDPT
jgi:cell division transport system permease protein